MKDRSWFEARLAEQRDRKAQLLADWNVACGIESFCQQVITEMLEAEAPKSVLPYRDGVSTTWGR